MSLPVLRTSYPSWHRPALRSSWGRCLALMQEVCSPSSLWHSPRSRCLRCWSLQSAPSTVWRPCVQLRVHLLELHVCWGRPRPEAAPAAVHPPAVVPLPVLW